MYETNLSTNEFLYTTFIKLKLKMKDLLKITLTKGNSADKQLKIATIKSSMIEVLTILSLETNSEELRKSYRYLSGLIVLGKEKNILEVISYCENQLDYP